MPDSAPFSSGRRFRSAFYIDGFNLYHAVEALAEPTLKWADLHGLAGSYVGANQTLERVAFFTAYNTWNAEKRRRHVNYATALEATGVEVFRANFDRATKYCKREDRYCAFHEEKQSDVGLATQAIADAYEDRADNFFFVTSDSDQIPTFDLIRSRFPEKRVYLIAPPNRLAVARDLGRRAHSVFELTAGRLRDHTLPPNVIDARGKTVAARPTIYGPHQKARGR